MDNRSAELLATPTACCQFPCPSPKYSVPARPSGWRVWTQRRDNTDSNDQLLRRGWDFVQESVSVEGYPLLSRPGESCCSLRTFLRAADPSQTCWRTRSMTI